MANFGVTQKRYRKTSLKSAGRTRKSKKERSVESPVILTLQGLLSNGSDAQPPVIANLLRQGDQMIISAAPKTGKSYLAQQIALSLALPFRDPFDRRFLFSSEDKPTTPFEIFRPTELAPTAEGVGGQPHVPADSNAMPANGYGQRGWRVLFVSLEMPPSEITRRLRQQLPHWEIAPGPLPEKNSPVPPGWEMGIKFLFGFEKANPKGGVVKRQNLDILVPAVPTGETGPTQDGADADRLAEIIDAHETEVIIYDTLIQLHSLNENDNVLMKAVLQKLRTLSFRNGKALPHIVIHHTRKENPAYRGPLSPEMMRGAGSVHGAADVVMLARLSEDTTKRDIIDVHVSSRSSDVPDFKLQKTKHLTFAWKVLTPDESLKRNEQKARAYQDSIKKQISAGRGDPVSLDYDQLMEDVKTLRAEKAWIFAIPKKSSPVAGHVEELVKTKQIEWACRFAPGDKGSWAIHPLRLKSDAEKPLWRDPAVSAETTKT